MEIQHIDTIEFEAHEDEGRGLLLVRKCDDMVAIGISLEANGDIETLVNKDVAERLIKALTQAVGR